MDEFSIPNNGKICYNKIGYQIFFNKDLDGYETLNEVKVLGNIKYLERNEFSEIEIDWILEKALRYVN